MGKRIATWLGVGVLFFAFFISMHTTVYAQWLQDEGCTDVQTDSGEEHPVPPNWHSNQGIIKIVASSETISPAAPVTLYVNSNGWGHPNYTWTPSGTGYTLSASQTGGDTVPVTLSVVGGTCATHYSPHVTVTVTDTLGAHDSIVIRNFGGRWVLKNNNVPNAYGRCNTYCTDCSSSLTNAEYYGFAPNTGRPYLLIYSAKIGCDPCTLDGYYGCMTDCQADYGTFPPVISWDLKYGATNPNACGVVGCITAEMLGLFLMVPDGMGGWTWGPDCWSGGGYLYFWQCSATKCG